MENTLTAIEITGTVNEYHELQLDDILPISGPKRVRVIVMYSTVDKNTEKEWLHTAAQNPAFDFLKDPKEDIYTLTEGKPYHDEV
jgi:hypothetical protein